MKAIWYYYKKYQEIINYLLVGGMTMVVSVASYALFAKTFHMNYDFATVLSWILAVTFAYITNKIFVFKSKHDHYKENIKEAFQFFLCRIASLVIDLGCMYLFIEIFGMNDLVAKIIDQFIIVVVNYVFSKLWVFKK